LSSKETSSCTTPNETSSYNPKRDLLTRAERSDKGFRQREWQTYDGNFVPPNLSYNDVPPCLAIGPYPQSKEDVELMKRNGVTGVLNVQTDFDHERRMIDWGHLQEYYKEADLQVPLHRT